jgi:hypothetical protein
VIDIELERPRRLDHLATAEFGAYTRRIRERLDIHGLD